MTANRVKTIIALIIIIASAGVFYLVSHPNPPSPDLHPHRALGEMVAQHAAKLLAGGKLVVIAPDTATFRSAAADAQLMAFYRELKNANLAVAATNLIKLDPLRLVRVPPGAFAELLRKSSEKDLIVSFLGPPLLTADQRAKLPEKIARVLAVCSGETAKQIPMRALFDSGLVMEAIISRPVATATGPHTDAMAEWFNHFFQVITAVNLNELPPPSATAALNY